MIYLFLVLSILTFLLFGFDKNAARMNQWRIPEKVLLGLSILGGAVGGLLGMQVFRHKTRKNYFWIILIAAACVHLFLVVTL
ncbi:MAG: DUF1294 domain-containing protein [Chloroflexi bacterium]|nr:DUF1294 domain-containing protein [Chloroflexota bacterium]